MQLREKQVVVIDDTAPIRTFLRISLSACGAIMHEADSATKGLMLCKDIRPDLVILDLGLPDKDGLEIIEEIKSLAKNAPKVIILSVRKEQSTKEKALSLGADDYVTKPFMMEDFIEIIEQHIVK